jgi:serine/threonine protein kinase
MPKRKGDNVQMVRLKKSKEFAPQKGDVVAEKYQIGDKLGEGTSGTVYSARNVITGLRVAIKVNRWKYTEDANNEIEMLKRCNDDNAERHVVMMLDHFIVGPIVCIVMELMQMELLDLLDKKKNEKPLNSNEIKQLIVKILKSLNALHECHITHSNILLKFVGCPEDRDISGCLVKFADLGFSEFDVNETKTSVGTLEYRAPEIVLRASSGQKIDVWSAGCTIYELATGNQLFNILTGLSSQQQDMAHLLLIEHYLGNIPTKMAKKGDKFTDFFRSRGGLLNTKEFAKVSKRLDLKDDSIAKRLSKESPLGRGDIKHLEALLLNMLNLDPRKRPTSSALLKYEFCK